MTSFRRFKYGLLLHPALPDPDLVAREYTEHLVASFADPFDPLLGSIDVRWQFSIVRVDDSVVFDVRHTPDLCHRILDDVSGPVRSGLLEALDWWNGETLLIAPQEKGLAWEGVDFPNAWSTPWKDGLLIQTITQYPLRLGGRVLSEWNPGLSYVPFEVRYYPPTREKEVEAMSRWTAQQEQLVRSALAGSVTSDAGPWFLSPAQRYRSALAPVASQLRPVGDFEAAEKAAQDYRGACFLIHQHTGETHSRWYER